MRLRTALNAYKQQRGGRFPEEAPTTTGALSGHHDRLVHVDRNGRFRDYSEPLSGLTGLDRTRFGIETDDGREWFDDIEPIRQHYYRETALVETEYDAGVFTVHQFDLTLGRAHLTHVELRGDVPADARLIAFLTFAPENRDGGVGRLLHREAGPGDGDVVEVFHRREHDYVAASTGITDVHGQIPERFSELLDPEPIRHPRRAPKQRYEDTRLSGDVVVTAPLEGAGRSARATIVTQLSDHDRIDRETAIADVVNAASTHDTTDAIREAARNRVAHEVPDSTPRNDVVTADLRVLSLLRAPSGARMAGPDYDEFYANSGGYGYTWFRDDAETARFLLSAGEQLDLQVDEELVASARLYCRTQRADGSWPHRVWPSDTSLAPGWANARLEGQEGPEYQADQTASVVTYLATLLTERPDLLGGELRADVVDAVTDGVAVLDETLTDAGLPEACQNAWEDMHGQFTHTAATYLEAYATVARAPLDPDLCAHAVARAGRVLDGLAALWDDDSGVYGLRLDDGELDARLDSATFALVGALVAADAALDLHATHVDRLVAHVKEALDGLAREENGAVTGFVRYEGDDWRTAGQGVEKRWSVATGLATVAAAELAGLLDERGRHERADSLRERAAEYYELLSPGGPFDTGAGFLAEQVFEDGTPDSAAPLGWSHALRLYATAVLDEQSALPAAHAPPEGPAERPRWTTGEKYGLGTAADHGDADASKVWFTLTEGALTEVRYPRVDLMNLRTVDFLVVDADPDSAYTARTHNETRTDDHAETVERHTELVDDDALVYRQTITESGNGRGHAWTLTVDYVADPDHDALLADVDFTAEDDHEYEVYAAAHTTLTNTGTADRGMCLDTEDGTHLVARDAGAFDVHRTDHLLVDENGDPYSIAVALTSQDRFEWATVGIGGTDRITRLFNEGRQPDPVPEIDGSNLVLLGRLGTGSGVRTELALGLAEEADTAAALGEAEGALARGFETARREYVDSWREFLADKPLPDSVADDPDLATQYRVALMTLRAVEDKTFHGASIASPSVPWGDAVYADEPKGYGYNFVWSRDLYQVFSVNLAVGEVGTAHDALAYVYRYQQDEAGFIPQNTYLQGRTRWGGEQMDNISFPAVMAYQLAEAGLDFAEADYGYEHVRRSADYVARNGPETAQERWEEEAGYSPSSIAAEISGLVCAGHLARSQGRQGDALTWMALADDWQARVADWTATTTGTPAKNRAPYYVRITRDGDPDAGHKRTLANNGPKLDERDIVDAGFLELVRLGIEVPDDPTVENSVAVVDDTIRVDTPQGPAFYRYNGDGYGELTGENAGAPWRLDANGRGRLWPIFTGERGEYELLAGTDEGPTAPQNCLETMARFANSGRMIAEQVWDRDASTEYNWELGAGTGSATPLAWSMAQYARLALGIDAGHPVETPTAVRERYQDRDGERPPGPSLTVDTTFEGNDLVVAVETDGAAAAVKTPSETVFVEPTGGEFVTRVGIEYGETDVIVAAASDTDLDAAGTTVERLTL